MSSCHAPVTKAIKEPCGLKLVVSVPSEDNNRRNSWFLRPARNAIGSSMLIVTDDHVEPTGGVTLANPSTLMKMSRDRVPQRHHRIFVDDRVSLERPPPRKVLKLLRDIARGPHRDPMSGIQIRSQTGVQAPISCTVSTKNK